MMTRSKPITHLLTILLLSLSLSPFASTGKTSDLTIALYAGQSNCTNAAPNLLAEGPLTYDTNFQVKSGSSFSSYLLSRDLGAHEWIDLSRKAGGSEKTNPGLPPECGIYTESVSIDGGGGGGRRCQAIAEKPSCLRLRTAYG